mmetsp:Transcript_60340/g.186811  ORF Transcript_60340/g.186811 Transcript_60340/m.186811 type:complete len:191 (+) Transcript_60340:92-664(+)
MEEEPPILSKLANLQNLMQHYVDKTTIWIKTRWSVFALAACVFLVRVYLLQGFVLVTYGLGVYLLNRIIGFLSPAVDPESDGPVLPTAGDGEEFRPFTRKLPEFHCWLTASSAVIVSFSMTFFEAFDLPVIWPMLLAYFIFLVVLTMKGRIEHMMKHKYMPFSFGKQKYGDLAKDRASGDKKEKEVDVDV